MRRGAILTLGALGAMTLAGLGGGCFGEKVFVSSAGSTGSTGSTTSVSTGTGGNGGTGGTPPMACVPGDPCKDSNACTTDSCVAGMCAHMPVLDADLANPDPNDCKKTRCENGVAVEVADDTEKPSDFEDCTDDKCVNGIETHVNVADGVPCGANMTLTCITGKCNFCFNPPDCGASTPECAVRTCNNQMCGLSFIGGQSSMQTSGDCQIRICDGALPNATVEFYPSDSVADGNECTTDTCTDGDFMTVYVNAAAGDPCAAGFCDGMGMCAACTSPGDCATNPVGTQCIANQCGCGGDGDCLPERPACDLAAGVCVECLDPGYCVTNPHGFICGYPLANVCGCMSDLDCPGTTCNMATGFCR